MASWRNLEAWARDRVGVTVDDVVAQYRREGLLLSDGPDDHNCWEVTGWADWGGRVPPLKPEVIAQRRVAHERPQATSDGSVGAMVYPDGRRVRILRLEAAAEGDLNAHLALDDLFSGEDAIRSVTAMMAEDGCFAEMSLAFGARVFPDE
jgi:hypothetical protein